MVNRLIGAFVFLFFITAYSCSRQPFRNTNKIYKKQAKQYAREIGHTPAIFNNMQRNDPYWIGTTNFNIRKPNFVIIHHTAQNSCAETLKAFTRASSQVSAHYVICKDGTIHHMLNDYLRSWHAGLAKWGSVTDLNSSSLGIEIDNNGFETFTEPQINSLLQLLDTLKRKYNIPAANFIGHSDIAPSRKVDPNIYFPWKAMADRGFGLWYADTTNVTVPETFNSLYALRIVGYDVRDSVAAVKAFKRHFLQDTSAVITSGDRKVLFDLQKKSM
ncbi:MAG: N-acetylmuramoyl-L-alanine amidase [Segetibacter sp.]|nr:N-acetylmuramoyl-L-alanine amidase [Segetibacter sp.]